MMMMFASDLDRTLIYSERALSEMGTPLNESMVPVERLKGNYISYMKIDALRKLKELASQLQFVPVTTRTYEQYKRIFIFEENIPITYSVTSNGANIHYKGEILSDWTKEVQVKLAEQCIEKEKLMELVNGQALPGSMKIADDLFFYYILEQQITSETKKLIGKIALENGWKVSLQGRKLYFMPAPVCKGEAVKFIQKREGIKITAGAGDSLLDFPLLDACTHAWMPKHGELADEVRDANRYNLTNFSGADAGEEIIETVHRLYKRNATPLLENL
ncbi:HAD family hydrolase [Niallia sp. MER 6]|uniref:HAD family hydrolase n=1 Tax=Niallia sp. MER 6 TaxID=2939567 RepID=UPI00203D642F|nr:HAD hydrolase family protein [Niallia sp. MER 6]MCM3030583.1 HAD hydrolase family protein [Niallia sp. MER 6]